MSNKAKALKVLRARLLDIEREKQDAAISAERKTQPVAEFIEGILRIHGQLDLSLSPVTVAELVGRSGVSARKALI